MLLLSKKVASETSLTDSFGAAFLISVFHRKPDNCLILLKRIVSFWVNGLDF